MVSRGTMVADLVTAARAGMEKLATKDEYIKPPDPVLPHRHRRRRQRSVRRVPSRWR